PRDSLPTETRRATRQLRIRAHGTPGQSQGRPPTTPGPAAHNVRRPAQPASPSSPWHPERADATATTGRRSDSTAPVSSPYNRERPHRGLALLTPDRTGTDAPPSRGEIKRRD